jgi:hypothetical protein
VTVCMTAATCRRRFRYHGARLVDLLGQVRGDGVEWPEGPNKEPVTFLCRDVLGWVQRPHDRRIRPVDPQIDQGHGLLGHGTRVSELNSTCDSIFI